MEPGAESLAPLLSTGLWAAESLHLLQRIHEAFLEPVSSERSFAWTENGEKRSENADFRWIFMRFRRFSKVFDGFRLAFRPRILASVDPNEDRFHGHGLPAFTSHLWARSDVEVLPGHVT